MANGSSAFVCAILTSLIEFRAFQMMAVWPPRVGRMHSMRYVDYCASTYSHHH